MPTIATAASTPTYNLVNASGETWRQWRNRWVSPYGLIVIGGMLAMIVLFYLIAGRKKLDEPRTGRKLLRWSAVSRSLHWSVATLFILLALSGLTLLYGKHVFYPLFGAGAWGAMVSASKLVHNYLGPLFGILLLILLAKLLVHNLPKKHDIDWFRKGGGLVGKEHPDAGFCQCRREGLVLAAGHRRGGGHHQRSGPGLPQLWPGA